MITFVTAFRVMNILIFIGLIPYLYGLAKKAIENYWKDDFYFAVYFGLFFVLLWILILFVSIPFTDIME